MAYVSKDKPTTKLLILSRHHEAFRDRQEAGQLLARELASYRGQNPVVLGIPRGGIVVARELATALDGELDIALSRKLRTPGHEELAMGSIAEDGHIFLDEALVRQLGITRSYIQQEAEHQKAEIARRATLIRRIRPKVPLRGRPVIITDDGVATGATMQAALWTVRQEQPQKLILAVPVAAEDTLIRLAESADQTLCLRAPPLFQAVGQFYTRFNQVEDEDVLAILKEEHGQESES